jgi:hypothetical protein
MHVYHCSEAANGAILLGIYSMVFVLGIAKLAAVGSQLLSCDICAKQITNCDSQLMCRDKTGTIGQYSIHTVLYCAVQLYPRHKIGTAVLCTRKLWISKSNDSWRHQSLIL